jgi:hypothetical protein
MVSNYRGDLTQFRMQHVGSFAKQTLVRANEHDTLLHVLRVMAASRISVLPIERKVEDQTHQKTTFTIGLLFLNDLIYLLGMPNFWQCLNEPVVEFFKELYGPLEYGDVTSEYLSEEDRHSMTFQQEQARSEVQMKEETRLIHKSSDAKMSSSN